MRRIPIHVICVAIVLAVAAIPARGERVGLKGRQELSVSWQNQMRPSDFGGVGDTLQSAIQASYGVFLWPNVEIKAGLAHYSMSYNDLPPDPYASDDSASWWSIEPSVAYHFLPKKGAVVVPYVGYGLTYTARAGLNAYDDSGGNGPTGFAFAGAKVFLGGDYTKSRHAIFLEGRDEEDTLTIKIGFLQFL